MIDGELANRTSWMTGTTTVSRRSIAAGRRIVDDPPTVIINNDTSGSHAGNAFTNDHRVFHVPRRRHSPRA